jgi:AraC family transcriptional regulator, regulatory protein of adaptative response / methylated-DNA-[protein]-cysteine methyltransferase
MQTAMIDRPLSAHSPAADPVEAGHLYRRLEAALRFIADNQARQPSLEEIAEAAHLSPHHFQRLFTRWVGVSPKRFLQYLTLDYAKARLGEAASVLDTAYDVGLSGPGRLHDLFVTHEAMTPGEFKQQGEGLVIRYGFHGTPFGDALLMLTDRGICGLAFAGENNRAAVLAEMAARWPRARLVEKPADTAPLAARIFAGAPGPIHLHLHGTNFQMRVWEALLRVPPGGLVSYGDLARHIGVPKGFRAVGAACGANPVSFLIPCHRAVLATGGLRHYAWGTGRKAALIGWEAARLAG